MKLTLRDLFWLVLVIGSFLGWWANRRQLVAENVRLQGQNRAAAEQARVAAHDWWIDAIKGLNDVDRLLLLARLAAEQPRPDYELMRAIEGP
jgi:hypothetical protein